MRHSIILAAILTIITIPGTALADGPRVHLRTDLGGGVLMPLAWPNGVGVAFMPVAHAGVGFAVLGDGHRAVQPAFGMTVHGMAGYIALGLDLEAGLGFSVNHRRHRVLLMGGPLLQSATLISGARAQGIGGYAETTILRQVRPRVLTGIRFRIGGVGAVPRHEAYSNISSTVEFVCLVR